MNSNFSRNKVLKRKLDLLSLLKENEGYWPLLLSNYYNHYYFPLSLSQFPLLSFGKVILFKVLEVSLENFHSKKDIFLRVKSLLLVVRVFPKIVFPLHHLFWKLFFRLFFHPWICLIIK